MDPRFAAIQIGGVESRWSLEVADNFAAGHYSRTLERKEGGNFRVVRRHMCSEVALGTEVADNLVAG